MLKGIGAALGGMARGIGRMGGETMESIAKAPEVKTPTPQILEAKPVSSNVINFAERLEAKARSGKNGPRAALEDLSNGNKPEEKPEENGDEEAPPPQPEKENLLANAASQAMETPQVDQSPIPGLKSKTVEELPEALGEKPENLPRSA